MNNRKGLIKFIYIIALLLLGIVVWGFFQSRTGNLTRQSLALDNELNDTLQASGFKNSDILSQYREERTAGAAVWIEYFRELKLPADADLKSIDANLASLARKHGCALKVAGDKTKRTYELFYGKKLFSRLILDRAASARAAASRVNKIAIVIDDVGYNLNDLGPYIELGIPITFAILPHENYSRKIAAELSAKKMPYILHLPLEPEQYPKVDPGKAALLISMNDREIERKFLSDLASVPGVSGVSNHMGSRFSSNPDKMRTLLKLVKEKGLFYFDSYTSTSTKAGRIAREIGLPFEENSVFVDLEDTPEFMDKQFKTALKKVKKYGQCAVIGHVHKKALPGALRSATKTFRENGVDFVYLGDIVRQAKK